MREVRLTKGFVAIVDDEDFELVNKHKWHVLVFKDGRKYATRTIRIDGRRTSQYMHSLITGFKLVDHINLDGLNNQRSNLRESLRSGILATLDRGSEMKNDEVRNTRDIPETCTCNWRPVITAAGRVWRRLPNSKLPDMPKCRVHNGR